MAYTAPQIGTILLKADRTMYKIGQIAYENMFAEDNEALDYERDIIFIYKKAVEYADDLFLGTEKLDKVVERLAAKISAYDYGELNPIYADAALLNISTVVAGSALNDLTDVTITNLLDNQLLRYNAATGQWINVGPGSAVRSSQAFTATAGQTVFTTSAPFDAGLFDLYLNGVKLNSMSYTTFGEYQITLNDACSLGDIVDVVIYDPTTGITPSANALNDLTDVSLGPLSNKQALYYNSVTGLWENGLVFVPYTGAVSSVNLGSYGITSSFYQANTAAIEADAVGKLIWDDTECTFKFMMKGGNVIQRIGQDLPVPVKHADNTGLSKGSVVYTVGSDGTNKTVRYAIATGDPTSSKTFGVIAETVSGGAKALCTTYGYVRNVNTIGLTEGAAIWLSPTVSGGMTSTKPSAPNHLVYIGVCIKSHATEGIVFVNIQNGYELEELHNVSINAGTLANGDVIKYNSTTQLWENGQPTGGISGSGASGQVAYWTGASSQSGSNNLFWDNANGRLGIGTNAPAVNVDILGSGTNGNAYLRVTRSNNTAGDAAFITQPQGTLSASNKSWNYGLIANSNTFRFWAYDGTTATTYLGIFNNGNVAIQNGGTFTDGGQRLQVQGTTLLNGNVTFSSSTGMTWDATNSRLGIGTNVPQRPLHIYSNSGMWVQSPTGGNSILVITPTGFDTLNQNFIDFSITANSKMRLFLTGNLALGSTTDTGERLQVTGNVKIVGSGATSATTALTVQNSSSTNLFTVRNDGISKFGSSTFFDVSSPLIVGTDGAAGARISIANNSSYQDFMFVNTSIASGNINNWAFGQRQDTFFGNALGSFQIVGAYSNNTGSGSPVGGGYRVPLICNPNGDVILAGASANAVNGNVLVGSTTSTGEKFQVTGTSKFVGAMTVNTSSAFQGITVVNSVSSTSAGRVTVQANTSDFSFFNHYSSSYPGASLANYGGFGSTTSIVIFTDAAAGSGGTGNIQFRVGGGADICERIRIKSSGQLRFIPLTSAPSNAESGDVYYNSTDNKHYGYNGTTWNAFY